MVAAKDTSLILTCGFVLKETLDEDYYQDAMQYFRDEYGDDKTVFLFVSDDMKWVRRNEVFKTEKNLYLVGCGDGSDMKCIGKDLALLAACNHMIVSHGSFGQWASYFAGGEIYTEYGAISPDAYQ